MKERECFEMILILKAKSDEFTISLNKGNLSIPLLKIISGNIVNLTNNTYDP